MRYQSKQTLFSRSIACFRDRVVSVFVYSSNFEFNFFENTVEEIAMPPLNLGIAVNVHMPLSQIFCVHFPTILMGIVL